MVNYVLHVLILAGIFTVLAVSLDLVAGHMGFVSLCNAAFYGLGAYTSALLAVRFGLSFVTGTIAGMGVAAVASLFVSLPSFRLRDDYFVIATFGFQMICFCVLNNWIEVTHGSMGISGIPQPSILGWEIRSHVEFVFLATMLAGLVYVTVSRVITSPFGRVLRVIREDELFARALGKNTLRFKVVTFATSAAFSASAGSLYSHYVSYIDPTSFTIMESILIISMVIIGGAGSLWGPLAGAFLLVTLPEAIRFIGLPGAAAANVRQLIYGTLLVIMMMFRPRGLLGKYSFTK